jgi:hypothetical protein
MGSIDEQILKTVKEVVIKFIECGRLSPTAFSESFQSIYKAVDDTVKAHVRPPEKTPEPKPPAPAPPKPGAGKR